MPFLHYFIEISTQKIYNYTKEKVKQTSHCIGDKMRTKVKEFRKNNNMTQKQLAELVHVSSRTIISIEKEQYSPSLMLAYRIAKVFDTSVEEICCLEENKRLEDEIYENL